MTQRHSTSGASALRQSDLSRRIAAEAVGTAFLLAVVVGSGIMAERLAGGNVALALLANAVATGAGLVALIFAFGSLSGAHFNPVVTLVDALRGGTSWRTVPAYISAQVAGAYLGVVLAHSMFDLAAFAPSQHARSGVSQWIAEVVATSGLILTILGTSRKRPDAVPLAVGAYITAAYWFTASTSFANPALTLARSFTDTFAGIRPLDAPGFIAAQLVGAALGNVLFTWLAPPAHESSAEPIALEETP